MNDGKDLERIITAIEKSLPSTGKIIPNYQAKDKDTGRSRQIDIAIFNKDAYREFFCMIEVKDWKRPVDTPEVEKIIKIKDSVNADKAIIVSRSGFTEPSIEKAKKYSIGTMIFEEVDSFDWKGFEEIESLKWEIHYYRKANLILDIPQEVADAIKLDLKLTHFRKKVFINQKNGKELSLSDVTRGCLVQNPHLADIMPLDDSIVTRELSIQLSDELHLMTDLGNFPIKSIIIEIDLQLFRFKSPEKSYVYRDVTKNKTVAEIIISTLPSSFGNKEMTVTVPGKGKIGGRTISINVQDIENIGS